LGPKKGDGDELDNRITKAFYAKLELAFTWPLAIVSG